MNISGEANLTIDQHIDLTGKRQAIDNDLTQDLERAALEWRGDKHVARMRHQAMVDEANRRHRDRTANLELKRLRLVLTSLNPKDSGS